MVAEDAPHAVVLVVSEDRRVRQALVTYLSVSGLSGASVRGTVYADMAGARGEIAAVVCDLDACDVDLALSAVAELSARGAQVAVLSASAALRRRALAAGAAAAADKWAGIDDIARVVRHAAGADRTGA